MPNYWIKTRHQVLKKPISIARKSTLIYLIGGLPNDLRDCAVCFQCARGVVESSVKLTNSKRDTWVLV